jgi:uncharacterized protein (DUF305 family)
MKHFNRKLSLSAMVVLAIAFPAAAQMQGMDMQKMMQMMSPAPNDSASTKDFKKAHMDMMHSMHMEFTGNPDVDFARSMMKHHEAGSKWPSSN